MPIRILITGGNGFLGKHVSKAMSRDRSVEILTPNSSKLNVLDYSSLSRFINDYYPCVILHMAAVCGGILANKNSPADFLRDNTQMALNIYEAARQYNVPQVYSLGSVCAYPKYCPTPFRENNIWNGYPEETNAPYGIAKRTLLTLSQTYRQQYGIGGAHLIPVNMYGEHDHFDLVNSHVIPALIRKFDDAICSNSDTVFCWGTGEATREFLYAGDAAEVIAKAVLTGFNNPDPVNLGTGQDVSIKDLASLIGRLMGFNGNIVFDGSVSDGQTKDYWTFLVLKSY